MKKTKIEHLHDPQIMASIFELFETIEVMYGIKEADERFINYFDSVLKKSYGHLTFEQIEDAFFRNSTGLLDNFLPKVGMRPDNKVMKFNIPDLTKIINAFCRYMGVEKTESKLEIKIFTEEEKKGIHKKWVSQLIRIYDEYINLNIKASITTPTYTANFLTKLGLIDEKDIDISEKKINTNFVKKTKKTSSSNQNLIYKCFDSIALNGEHLNDFIHKNNDFSKKMPY